MITSYLNFFIQIFIVIFLASNVAYSPEIPPHVYDGERICREQIYSIFKTLTDGESCLKTAFLFLQAGMPLFTGFIAAEMFYISMKSEIHPGRMLPPEQFCEYYCGEEQKELTIHSIEGYITPSKDRCISILKNRFSVEDINPNNKKMVMQQIVNQVYDKESIDLNRYTFINFRYYSFNPEYPNIMANYVYHVSENFGYNRKEYPSPISFCRRRIFSGLLFNVINSLDTDDPNHNSIP